MKQLVCFNPEGSLISLDVYGCSFELLNSIEFLLREATRAAQEAEMKILAVTIVPFHPQGLSLAIIFGESHLTIHTTPEYGYAGIDVFTCGDGNPMKAAEHLMKVLKPKHTMIKCQKRGTFRKSREKEEELFSIMG